MRQKNWTEKEKKAAAQLYADGEAIEKIAAKCKRSFSSVEHMLRREGYFAKITESRHSKDYKKKVAEAADLKRQVARLEKAMDHTKRQLHAARLKKLKLPSRAARASGKSFVRVLAGDFHGTKVSRQVLAALVEDLKSLKPGEFIWGGDVIDCGGFLAQHHALGYVADSEYSYADDLEFGNNILDEVGQVLPEGTRQRYIEGNHEHRVERWIMDQTHNNKDAKLLRSTFGPEIQLRLADRKIEWHAQGEFHDDIGNRGTIDLGNCMAVHGASHAKNATQKHVDFFGTNVIHFHTHRADESTSRTVKHGLAKAWCPGCCCELQPTYLHSKPSGWSQGYHVQVVDRASGLFLGFNVPIENGLSMLSPLLEILGAAA